MDIKEFAQMLNGREYGKEIGKAETLQAKELGLVVVYGASDDLMEFEGAIRDEVGCYDGGTAYLTKTDLFDANGGECECECKYYQAEKALCKTITAVWCGEENYSWTYKTDIPHETFDIYEDGEKYCRGIVFDIKSLQ